MKDKVIVITGASQGLGRELALQLSKLGAIVALVARTEKLLADLKTEINASGGVSEYFVCDVTDFNQVDQSIKKIIDCFDHVDVLINNAGVWTGGLSLEDLSAEKIKSTFETNSIGPVFFVKSLLPHFKSLNKGHIVNVISDSGLDVKSNQNWLVYASSKWALTGFSKALRHHLDSTNIKVSDIFPDAFKSNLLQNANDSETGRSWKFMYGESVAKAIVYVLSAPDDMNIDAIGMEGT